MATAQVQTYIPTKVVKSDYPRVVGYARPSDYAHGAIAAAFAPGALLALEKFAPSHVGKGGLAQAMRLAGAIGLAGGFLYFYQRSSLRFYGATENAREVEMDMKEMVSKVKAGKPLYGESRLTPHMQGVAARQSRYSALFMGVVPWFNFVNHNQHGVDTAKYYQQAERELEAERLKNGGL
ncbi:hypothetical protein COL26b_013313 [Colletotrichum chrysophilum]|uniref:uncharacterized protein n=1 Tax=Colletotrichum chrysophilum TaxID=1836956 RepID=UPI0023008946|nr:uncharacterized protein COL26b_013313 [Colletotrichum chrysophilum]KAJ0362559.1 hypothetical protein COL26b_013313 [Colletotrichum chrysophilum]